MVCSSILLAASSANNPDPIKDIILSCSHTKVVSTGVQVTFTISLSRGTFVTYSLTYEDGVSITQANRNTMAFRYPETFTHTYSNPGNMTVRAQARNAANSESASVQLYVQHTLRDITFESEQFISIPTGKCGVKL